MSKEKGNHSEDQEQYQDHDTVQSENMATGGNLVDFNFPHHSMLKKKTESISIEKFLF